MSAHTRLSALAALVVAVAGLAGCSAPPRPSPTPARAAWLGKLLRQQTCQAPCWERIVPGVTTVLEAVDLLQANPDVVDIQGPTLSLSDDLQVSWRFTASQSSGQLSGDRTGLVRDVTLSLDSGQTMVMDDIVQTFGAPAEVRLQSTDERPGQLDVDAVYLRQGLLVGLQLPGSPGGSVAIAGSSPINLVEFFPSGEAGFEGVIGKRNFVAGCLPAWHGYAVYAVGTC